MNKTSGIERSFRSLSLRDVLDAREAYHVHLVNQKHVVATAVGRYLVRRSEKTKQPLNADKQLNAHSPGTRPPRTLEGCTVEDWSWPCVIVLVDHWMTEDELNASPNAIYDMVPPRLYLPDGRVVPTCVVYAPPSDQALEVEHLNFPSDLIGGGYVARSSVQGRERVGSIACLVTNGDTVYALTNQHVAGEANRALLTTIAGRDVVLGKTNANFARRVPFQQAYPSFSGSRLELAIDAGLIEPDDLERWTTQVYGVGQVGEMLDVSEESLSLDMIGTPVRAFGAASGALEGEVMALFYRYRTVGGVEHIADVLIGPRGTETLHTRPGDSGTLWLIESEPDHAAPVKLGGKQAKSTTTQGGKQPVPTLRPLAMQWGGHTFVRGGTQQVSPYALASFLSNVCRALDVEVVRDWNLGHDQYWGQTGHYTIGAKACELLTDAKLKAFFMANQTNISFDLQTNKLLRGGASGYSCTFIPKQTRLHH